MSFAEVPIEAVQRYWDDRPCNIRHSTAPVGSREYFDQVEWRKYFVEPHIPRFAEFARWQGKRVLEVGCGIGTDTVNFARAGASVTAVDLSSASLDLARKRVETFGLAGQVTFHHGDAEHLTDVLPVEPYDLVYSFGVVHHTPHPERALALMRHFVKPRGTLKVMVYHRRSWKVAAIVLEEGQGRFWRLDELVARSSEAQTGCPVTYSYSRKSGRRLLEQAGFDITRVEVDHIFPYRVQDYVQHRYTKAFPFSVLPAPASRALERALGWHLLLTATT